MTYSIISKTLVIGLLLTSACSTVAFADQGLGDQKALQDHDDTSVITENQQRSLEMKMFSWQQNLADNLQEEIDNTLIIKGEIDHQQDLTVFSSELAADHKRMVQN